MLCLVQCWHGDWKTYFNVYKVEISGDNKIAKGEFVSYVSDRFDILFRNKLNECHIKIHSLKDKKRRQLSHERIKSLLIFPKIN